MYFKEIKTKLFKAYLKHVHGDLQPFQFDKKIIFYKRSEKPPHYDPTNQDNWVLYYDIVERSIFIINEQRSYPIDSFLEKINKLKIFF